MVEGAIAEKPKKSYPIKLVTFPSEEKRQQATDYCDAVGIGFAELMRKLLAAHMKANPPPMRSPAAHTIRVIKEPGP